MDRQKVLRVIEERQLTSVMNKTKWEELRRAVAPECLSEAPYQIKYVLEDTPDSEYLSKTADLSSDWDDGFPDPTASIEWMRILPIVKEARGSIMEPEIHDVTDEFHHILRRLKIPFVMEGEIICIFGYVRDTGIFERGEN
ncbi:DUF6678 family protein [Exiguobacterium sp. SL-9]|uniref:DUF6678 family protein n=1 Tax=Exiguobacterium sp. SL-9 TaxID=2510963 RepID=UPI00103D7DEB|nr:DUF6678 family protein [Exiguobacterium sp. SL-9]TCI22300.1 hypothetical protein EVJ34_06690 [Exiguobacterium sp. SL-9]